VTASDREVLLPEDATSLEEFQARRVAEQTQIRAMNSSWKRIGLILLSSLLFVLAFTCWGCVAIGGGSIRWFFLVFALGFSFAFLRIFGKIELRGVRGSKRYMQLTSMSKDWQARAGRGEIPATTPGGAKIWRDQVNEAETR
jgi:hypothetical protein